MKVITIEKLKTEIKENFRSRGLAQLFFEEQILEDKIKCLELKSFQDKIF